MKNDQWHSQVHGLKYFIHLHRLVNNLFKYQIINLMRFFSVSFTGCHGLYFVERCVQTSSLCEMTLKILNENFRQCLLQIYRVFLFVFSVLPLIVVYTVMLQIKFILLLLFPWYLISEEYVLSTKVKFHISPELSSLVYPFCFL